MQDAKLPLSSKGKAREDTHWQLGWWDLSHSLEGTRRPLVWSKSSVIFTAHPTDPLVIGRHFSSSKQFAVPSPPQVLSSPASYDPPTVVSVSPTDDWLFAYFPGRGGDGAGCLWKRGSQLDSWAVREWWSFPPGAGVVVAEWTCSQREWVVTDTGSFTRLPPRGPLTPLSSPILLLITQNHQINVCSIPPYVPSLKITRASLMQASKSFESQTSAADDATNGLGGQSICVTAAIGMGYNEHSILVAMRSHILPSHNVNHQAHDSMVLDLSLDIAQPGSLSEIPLSPEWELWGEELIVQLCEVKLLFNTDIPGAGVLTRPLPPIFDAHQHLTNLVFVAVPPDRPSAASPEKRHDNGKTAKSELYLAITCLDFADLPKSEIMLHALKKKSPLGSKSVSIWVSHTISRQTFEDRIPDFVLPSLSRDSLLVGSMNLSGTVTARKDSIGEANIGRISILKIPDLSPNTLWEEVPILSNTVAAGRQVLGNVAYSPNRSLICSVSPSTSMNSHIAIHGLPHKHGHESSAKDSSSAAQSRELSLQIAAAIRARNSSSDVIHPLTQAVVSTEMIVDTLCHVLKLLQGNMNSAPESCLDEVLGLAVEIYSRKAGRQTNDANKENLNARWKIAHDILSLSACCSGFEECKAGPVYDLDAVWQLIGLASWFVEFVETLLKECVLVGDGSVETSSAAPNFTDLPIFIHLAHPHPLGRMKTALSHVKRFRDHIAKLSASGENAQIAKDVLMDVVDSSGVDLDQLSRVLDEILQDLQPVDANGLHRSLIACCPPPYLGQHLRKAVGKILTSNVINRSRLFIKPADLIDGVSRLSLTEGHAKAKLLDVVSKALLLPSSLDAVCVRCAGRSQVGLVDTKNGPDDSLQWRLWERRWATNCVCGGSWVKLMLG